MKKIYLIGFLAVVTLIMLSFSRCTPDIILYGQSDNEWQTISIPYGDTKALFFSDTIRITFDTVFDRRVAYDPDGMPSSADTSAYPDPIPPYCAKVGINLISGNNDENRQMIAVRSIQYFGDEDTLYLSDEVSMSNYRLQIIQLTPYPTYWDYYSDTNPNDDIPFANPNVYTAILKIKKNE